MPVPIIERPFRLAPREPNSSRRKSEATRVRRCLSVQVSARERAFPCVSLGVATGREGDPGIGTKGGADSILWSVQCAPIRRHVLSIPGLEPCFLSCQTRHSRPWSIAMRDKPFSPLRIVLFLPLPPAIFLSRRSHRVCLPGYFIRAMVDPSPRALCFIDLSVLHRVIV